MSTEKEDLRKQSPQETGQISANGKPPISAEQSPPLSATNSKIEAQSSGEPKVFKKWAS